MSVLDQIIDGRYRLETELGRGGFGAVYRAKQVALGMDLRDVALKLFHQGAVDADNVRDKMNDAIQLLRVLAAVGDSELTQHFVGVYDLGVSRDEQPQAFVAMEFIKGGSLHNRIRDHAPLNTLATMQYLVQITRAIGFMHTMEEPMLHRDLKPDNLLLERRGAMEVIKVADFGLATMMESSILTNAAGALGYMPPEGLEYNAASPASDVYSIGLIACDMLLGKQPFAEVDTEGADAETTRRRHIEARRAGVRIDPSRTLDLSAHPKFQKVLDRMLVADLSQRYANAQLVHNDLCRICDEDWPEGIYPKALMRAVDDERERIAKDRRHIEYLLHEGKFGEAASVARRLCESHPKLADGYLSLAGVYRRQATRLDIGTAHGATTRKTFLQKAGKEILSGLDRVEPGADRELLNSLAEVYAELGDHATAATWRQRAIQQKGGGR